MNAEVGMQLQNDAPSKRQNTKLEAEGAEFLVLGMLLIEGIQCFKAYTNFAGYDLVAVDSSGERSARIQVKSRWATDYDRSFPIKNFNCDFVVLAALNRGYRFRQKANLNAHDGRSGPRFYCFPVELVQKAQNPIDTWGKVSLSRIFNHTQYEDAWHLIRTHLTTDPQK
ncbi:group I intron-associated PD-(D/E)XK endonuclease [Mesorhizobium captivum]|uniref:group I intron-associated PD-(D/E)XK endonuclease n=1 Tax=Mesorhizobium captivum TaxID=3072319 RepID=UPI002A242357|nr:group I intron-associated PD-(D/E)XK endonuclease [Mesorhizobium sp. VK3C]MDX8450799.1 group I intron-associated PD-(D/E)XK endonuclease [Mesorhizobium sp. VK3C]